MKCSPIFSTKKCQLNFRLWNLKPLIEMPDLLRPTIKLKYPDQCHQYNWVESIKIVRREQNKFLFTIDINRTSYKLPIILCMPIWKVASKQSKTCKNIAILRSLGSGVLGKQQKWTSTYTIQPFRWYFYQ